MLCSRLLAYSSCTYPQRKYFRAWLNSVKVKFNVISRSVFRATDIAKSKKKTKVVAEDVFTALQELEFESYEEGLRDFLKNYNADKED